MNMIVRIGGHVLKRWAAVLDVSAIIWAFLYLSLKPGSWRRPVRGQVARQVFFTGVEAVWIVALVALLTGVSVVAQTQLWLTRFGQTELLGSILVAVIIREVGPLLVNFIVIGRSGTAITTELANMRVRKEVRLLDAQGIEPMLYLLLPRVWGIVISILCLSVLFVIISLVSGYLFGFLLGVASGDPGLFMSTVFSSVEPVDTLNFAAKTLVPGLITGAICCLEGLSIGGLITEVPQATTRSVVKSIIALLLVFAIVSVFRYV